MWDFFRAKGEKNLSEVEGRPREVEALIRLGQKYLEKIVGDVIQRYPETPCIEKRPGRILHGVSQNQS